MTPHEFLKYIPATNCGECGYAACLAFAVAVTRGGLAPERCPYLDKNFVKEVLPVEDSQGQDERDMALVAHLKSTLQELDFSQLSPCLGTAWSAESADNPEQLVFHYLGRSVRLGRDEVLMDGEQLVDPRDQILLYNYVAFGGTGAGGAGTSDKGSNKGKAELRHKEARLPNGTWVGMESLPNSIAKIRTLATYCEARLAERFAGRLDELALLCQQIGGEQAQSADFAAILPVLPHVPLYLLFWDQDVEDGFEARVKILFDQHVMNFLDLESLVFAAERMADRLLELQSTLHQEAGH